MFKKIANLFNGESPPSAWRARRMVAAMKTPEGREKFMAALARHPQLADACDKRNKSALYHAAAAGDTPVMERLIGAGIKKYFFHDAIYGAAHANQRPALDLLLARGGAVDEEHIEVTQNMADFYTEPGPEGEPGPHDAYGRQCYKGLEMLREAFAAQQEKRAADAELKKQVGPLVLTEKITVSRPPKLRARRGFFAAC